MSAKLDAGESVSQDFTFTAHDLFSVTGANHSARSYSRLSDALERLQYVRSRKTTKATIVIRPRRETEAQLGLPDISRI